MFPFLLLVQAPWDIPKRVAIPSPDSWSLFARELQAETAARRPDLVRFWERGERPSARFDPDRERGAYERAEEAWNSGRKDAALRIFYTGIVEIGTDMTPLFDDYVFRLAQLGRWSEVRDVIAANREEYEGGTDRTLLLAVALTELGDIGDGVKRYLDAKLREGYPCRHSLAPYERKDPRRYLRIAWMRYSGVSIERRTEAEDCVTSAALARFPNDLAFIGSRALFLRSSHDSFPPERRPAAQTKTLALLKRGIALTKFKDLYYQSFWEQLRDVAPAEAERYPNPTILKPGEMPKAHGYGDDAP